MFFGLLFLVLFLFLLVVGALLPFLTPILEPRALFHPERVPFYDNLPPEQTDLHVLPSGGLVVRYHGSRPKSSSTAGPSLNDESRAAGLGAAYRPRRLLFVHGNAGHVGYFMPAVRSFDEAGYDVYLLEYHGYGMSRVPTVSAVGLIQDLREAWQCCSDNETILAGFSLGGIVIGQCYQELTPTPAQIVFLNTFGNLPVLAAEVSPLGISRLVTPFMITRDWITPEPPESYRTSVLIVCTYDDEMIPPRHSWALHNIFTRLSPMLVTVPDGGHETGPFLHWQQWRRWLLSPLVSTSSDASATSATPATGRAGGNHGTNLFQLDPTVFMSSFLPTHTLAPTVLSTFS